MPKRARDGEKKDDFSSKKPRKDGGQSLGHMAKVSKVAVPATEIDFPRGGGSSLTPLEQKTIYAEAAMEVREEGIIKVCLICLVESDVWMFIRHFNRTRRQSLRREWDIHCLQPRRRPTIRGKPQRPVINWKIPTYLLSISAMKCASCFDYWGDANTCTTPIVTSYGLWPENSLSNYLHTPISPHCIPTKPAHRSYPRQADIIRLYRFD